MSDIPSKQIYGPETKRQHDCAKSLQAMFEHMQREMLDAFYPYGREAYVQEFNKCFGLWN